MATLKEILPDAETLVALDPEELGAILLRVLVDRKENNGMFHPGNFESEVFPTGVLTGSVYPLSHQPQVLEAIREAFAWLEGQALIVSPDASNARAGWRRVGRRGRRLATVEGFQAYREASKLPRTLLHHRFSGSVYFNFQRGDYQTAVFLAFREIEIAVREKSGITDEVGAKLMRKAFDKDKGPLRDPDAEEGEREGRAHLFAGAVQTFKNPHSHRSIGLTPADAVDMLLLASHLLRIVDAIEASPPK